ncbi:MAG: hypothetical protein RBS68_00610 [Anaerolineales bacterium]|jgi:hypothetical protein|nr:hypothetical protein [Anaerolineales bacterium]
MFCKKGIISIVFTLGAFATLFLADPVYADIAPPESPPGANPVPATESTQVRMLSETVTLTILPSATGSPEAVADTRAVFNMRNLGTVAEQMQVRFPLSFFAGESDGRGNFPEIGGITVKIDGKTAATQREMQPVLPSEFNSPQREQIPWAVFNVTFPPGQDVTIEVAYRVKGFGYPPHQIFRYVLQTGAGWKGTIGAADIIVRLPYPASGQNIRLGEVDGYQDPTSGGVISANEVRWHFEDFEPTDQDNFMVVVLTPSLWQTLLKERENVAKNPKDGESWGRLGKAYKETIMESRGLRSDAEGHELFRLSREAYEKCLALLPKDSLWHYGYADLLWAHYYFDISFSGQPDAEAILPLTLSHLQTALQLDPKNQRASELLREISYSISGAVKVDGDEFIYLGLTATPAPPTPFRSFTATPPAPPTEQATQPATQHPTKQATRIATAAPTLEARSTAQANAPLPICGSASLVLPGLALAFWLDQRKRATI